jgi:hypothetical protein
VDFRLKLILGGLLALVLGLAVSSPILFSELTPVTRIQLDIDVQYAYFGVQDFSQDITGLWRNVTYPQENYLHLVSYLIVLNITNHSGKLVYIEEFEAAAGPRIVVDNGTVMVNKVVYDVRTIKWAAGCWDQYWSPNESRLIGLTGMTDVYDPPYLALLSGTLYLYGHVEGISPGEKSMVVGSTVKQVQLQTHGREFLYNALLSENQMLQLSDTFDVSVQPRR